MAASVPNEPAISLERSKPVTFLTTRPPALKPRRAAHGVEAQDMIARAPPTLIRRGPGEAGADHAADVAEIRPLHRAAAQVGSARRQDAGVLGQQRLDLGERGRGLRGEHQLLRLVGRTRGERGQIEPGIGIARPADQAFVPPAATPAALATAIAVAHRLRRPVGVSGRIGVITAICSKPAGSREAQLATVDMHAAQFGAAMQRRKDLAGIEQALGVEGAFQPLLLLEVDRR